jgi:FtsP/CotA-like multicopper oxidase with cupredoxin domain
LDKSRRKFVIGTAALATAGAATVAAQHEQHGSAQKPPETSGPPAADKRVERKRRREVAPAARVVPVEAPDIPKMEWTQEGQFKVFRIRAEVLQREFITGKWVNVWGFNGSMPGPVVEITEGDHVRFIVENHLPEDFSMHWHGLEVPFGMDGVPGLQQDPIPPGGSFTYEFQVNQNGTFFYHSHMPMQEMMGMIGPLVVHPKVPHDPPVDRDFVLVWQEWALLPNNDTPNTLAMEFNWLTINGKAGPDATPMLAKQGERIRVRNINLGMDHHPIHLHGNQFVVTGTEGGRKPQSTWFKENTVVLGVAQSRDFEFTGQYLGAWMLHCHFPHHMMNAMASMVGPMFGIGSGLTSGSQENGMGMMHGGNALSEDMGPKFGRTLAVGAEGETQTTNAPVTPEGARLAAGSGTDHSQHGGAPAGQMDHSQHGGAQQGGHEIAPGVVHSGTRAPNARQVPGFPQDMVMIMDDLVAKPETHGLRPTWTIGMMGMMTLIRVLTPAEYDEIVGLRAGWRENETQKRARAYGRSKIGGRTGAPVQSAPAGHDHHD